jgi:hypothetical protein
MTQEELKAMIHYNPESGVFTWIKRPWARSMVYPGDIAGNPLKNKYLQFSLNNKTYLAHRAAFLYMTGEWPDGLVDHIDRNRANNSWSNLRLVTRKENTFNKTPIPGKSGFLGVFKVKNKYYAHISVDNKKKHIGVYNTPEEAHQAYLDARAINYIIKE